MSRLSQMLLNEQGRRGQTDREAAAEIGVLQQTYSAWKHKTIPRPNTFGPLAKFLNISIEMLEELCEEARESTGSTKLPRLDKAREYGRVSDRKEGKFKFDPVNVGRKRIPEGRYTILVGTNVMEPALLYGTKAWLDPAVWPRVGNEVLVHSKGGVAWLGRLEALDNGRAEISQHGGGRIVVDDVQAVHAVVLSERVADKS
ncbi:XRE family helix-turn-helix protein [Rhizobium phage RHph_X2_25]|nr:XRE family helix-turn-helix protein [Rhizobium phage RHph_X2_25]